jgi:hypothetical protein
MTELEGLDRDISGLKELLRVAWKHLANPLLTPFERREVRNQIKQCSAELRGYLQTLEAERRDSRGARRSELWQTEAAASPRRLVGLGLKVKH